MEPEVPAEGLEPRPYNVVDVATGEVVNTINWDGVTPYDPGEGLELVPVEGD